MPAYNAAETISTSIQSVLNQSHVNLELIVVNDGSRDGTASVVDKYFDDLRLRYIDFETNKGVAEARNAGIREAKGDYIAFCDADDCWLPEKLSAQLAAMNEKSIAICGTNCLRVSDDGTVSATSYEGHITYRDMLVRNYIVNSSGIYSVRALGKHFQSPIRHEDYDMWLRLLEKSDAIVLPESMLRYRVARNSLSGNKIKSIFWHLKVQVKNRVPPHVIAVSFIRNVMSRLNG